MTGLSVVWCGTGWLSIVEPLRRRLPAGTTIRVRDPARPIALELADAQVILASNCRIDAAALSAPRDLRLIQQPAAGVDAIDLETAKARGIPVCNAPTANGHSLAELALLFILALARRWKASARGFAAGRIGDPIGLELHGKVLGVVGMGRSGQQLAGAAAALGMRVTGITSSSPPEAFHALLADADVVSLHCPLTPRTVGLFDRDAFARMKPGALLVNCARGGLIDRGALEEALAAGTLGGVGLDVYWAEPWDPTDPLYARDDVLTLPHVASCTDEAFERTISVVVANVERLLSGAPLLHRIV